jgi:hypothetical protein
MHERAIRGAVAGAAAACLLATSLALADTVVADGDEVAGIQGTVGAGPVTPGRSATLAVWFELTCRNAAHVDAGQTVAVTLLGATVPGGGAVTGGGTSIGPVPAEWPDDGSACGTTAPLRSAVAASVTVRAPASPGTYDYVLQYGRSLSPAGSGDGSAVSGFTFLTVRLTVVPDEPPVLVMPAAMVVEGDTIGGAVVSYVASSTDLEDEPDPVPGCSPASGSTFPLGTTTVTCAVTDSAGHVVGGEFAVTVVDTTAPVLAGVPAGLDLVTADEAGAVAVYDPPTALDVVDGERPVACAPVSGTVFAVGETVVVCGTADTSGNAASASFPVRVTYDPPTRLEARFDAPVGPSNVVHGAAGRTVPVKVRLLRDGAAVATGRVDLDLAACGSDSPLRTAPLPLTRRGDRWTTQLATAGLGGCVRATVRLDGRPAGSFELRLAPSAGAGGTAAPGRGRPT